MSEMARPIRATHAKDPTAAPSAAGTASLPIACTQATAGTAEVPAVYRTGHPILLTEATDGTGGPSAMLPDRQPIPATQAKALTAAGPGMSQPPQPISEAKARAGTAAAAGRRLVADPQPWGDLRMFRAMAEGLADAAKARISTANRVERGGVADAIQGPAMLAIARDTEKRYQEMLMAAYAQRVPAGVRDWAAGVPGIASGELFPKLLGLLGHPRIAIPWRWEGKVLVADGEPYERSLRQLWQYCGCGDPERIPRKNATREELLAAGKRRQIRPLLYTFSSYLVRMHTRSEAVAGSRYYRVHVQAKLDAQGNVHERECRNRKPPPLRSDGCGTTAHPEWGEPGSLWRPGHTDMHAHRIVHKEFLRDLWVVSGEA